jgi:N-hydroxyarylamine O-acetyltransferase
MNTDKYLRRLGIDQNGFVADAENLKSLQRRHLRRVPFENLDIHWKRPIIWISMLFSARSSIKNAADFVTS